MVKVPRATDSSMASSPPSTPLGWTSTVMAPPDCSSTKSLNFRLARCREWFSEQICPREML